MRVCVCVVSRVSSSSEMCMCVCVFVCVGARVYVCVLKDEKLKKREVERGR